MVCKGHTHKKTPSHFLSLKHGEHAWKRRNKMSTWLLGKRQWVSLLSARHGYCPCIPRAPRVPFPHGSGTECPPGKTLARDEEDVSHRWQLEHVARCWIQNRVSDCSTELSPHGCRMEAGGSYRDPWEKQRLPENLLRTTAVEESS